MKKVLAVILCISMLTAVFAGCADSKVPADLPSEEKSEGTGTSSDEIKENFLKKASEVSVSEDSVTFKDANGVEMTVKKDPQKTAILYASFTTLWYEAGGKASGVIGGDSAAALYEEYIGRDITKDEGVAVLAKTGSGKKWDVEKIIASQPDLIICSTAMNGYSIIKEPAQAASIPVIAVDYSDFSDYLKWFKVFSSLTGNENLWEEVALKALSETTEIISSVPSENNPVVFSMFSGARSLQANTDNTVVGMMIKELGGTNIVDAWDNPESSDRLEINLETVVASDPDIILVQCQAGSEEAQKQIEEIYKDNEVWNSLRAIKEGKVFYLQKSLFHNKPNSRFSEAYKAMYDIFYPAV